MKILAKSIINKEQIDCKINIGCDGIEIQLLTELIDKKVGCYHNAWEIFDLNSFAVYPIKAVHLPLLNYIGQQDVNLEDLCETHFALLDQAFYIANYFGKHQKEKVLVIVHSETSLNKLLLNVDGWRRMVNAIGCLLFKYPYTELGIENVAPVCGVLPKNIHMFSNFYNDNIEICTELRKELKTDRIGTVLDTCHAMITKKYMDIIQKEYTGKECDFYNLETFFKINKDYIKLIHLANMNGNGYGFGNHGARFDSNSKDKLEEIITYYNKYNYNCPVTLEINEKDYLLCDEYRITKETLDDVLKQKLL